MSTTGPELPSPSFEDFAAAARAEGFDEVLEREWKPGVVLDTHTHPFAVKAVVTRGEMWLTQRGATQHLRAGDRFEVDLEEPHAERYGAEGASYLVARANNRRLP